MSALCWFSILFNIVVCFLFWAEKIQATLLTLIFLNKIYNLYYQKSILDIKIRQGFFLNSVSLKVSFLDIEYIKLISDKSV